MKIKDFVQILQSLDQDKNIFLQNFMMCDEFEVLMIKENDIGPWSKGITESNIGDYFIQENENWLERNASLTG